HLQQDIFSNRNLTEIVVDFAFHEKTLLAQGHTDPKSQWIILQYTRKLTILQGFLEKFCRGFSVFFPFDGFESSFFHFIQNKIEKTLVKSSLWC
ncbi:MAG: hypothetical protein IJ313_06010, partial [Clostridia bacterium]|nr:hypothetical protein [Clostridia bacterium]